MSERIAHGSLKTFNTFGIDATADTLWLLDSLEDFRPVPAAEPLLLLSGGSNVLFLGDVAGTVLHSRLRGIQVVEADERQVRVRAAGGENWHDFVAYCLEHGFYGLENLALIPGSVGAAPVQNIGAYGVELAQRLVCVDGIDLTSGKPRRFLRDACRFGYRDSIFKHELRDRFLITQVEFLLERHPCPDAHYAALRSELTAMGITEPTPRDIFEAVCRVRRSKLPDPARLGNAGSFFKNPTVSAAQFVALKAREAELVAYPLPSGDYKLAAGWLIERCGLRGARRGAAGVHDRQSLVLVNHGGASGQDILALAREVQDAVFARFAVRLEPEVRIVGGRA